MFEAQHPAHKKLQEIGQEITAQVEAGKISAVVVFSAHWAGEPNIIEVNTAPELPLIYDFYGFPVRIQRRRVDSSKDPG